MAVQYLRQLPKLQHEHCSERQQKIEWHKNKNTSTEEPLVIMKASSYQQGTEGLMPLKVNAPTLTPST